MELVASDCNRCTIFRICVRLVCYQLYCSRRWLRIRVCYRKQSIVFRFLTVSAVSYRLRVSIRCLIQSDNYRCRNRCCIIADCRVCTCCFCNRIGVGPCFRIADASEHNICLTACRRIRRYRHRVCAFGCFRHRCIILCGQYKAELVLSDCHRLSAICIRIRLLYSKLCLNWIWLRVGICKRWTACCSSINLVAYICLQRVIRLFCNYYRYIYRLIRVGVACFSFLYFRNGIFVGSFLLVSNLSEVYPAVCCILYRLVCCKRYPLRCRSILQYEAELICTQCFSAQRLCDGNACLCTRRWCIGVHETCLTSRRSVCLFIYNTRNLKLVRIRLTCCRYRYFVGIG